MNIEYVFIIVALSFLFITFTIHHLKKTLYVSKNSNLLSQLTELNNLYTNSVFHSYPSKEDTLRININEEYKNKSTYDDLNGSKVLKKIIKIFIENIDDFTNKINKIDENINEWESYQKEYENILSYSSQFDKSSLIKTENKLLNKRKLQKPISKALLTYEAKYTSKKGKNWYTWTWEYDLDDIKLTLEDALNEIEYQKSKEHFKKVQRNKINDSTRFEVFKRDGYRCKICGMSPETNPEVTLHLDHIIPVALGGTSVIENLQTLCSSCNMGKKAKLM
jgi:5-methylcytosine-specific restriction endonuclease McrA